MSGRTGMVHRKPRENTARKKMWQSMRIMRHFTIPDLIRTTGATRSNVQKFLMRLQIHGIVAMSGHYTSGRAGIYRKYRLVRDTGSAHPVYCDVCGGAISGECRRADDRGQTTGE